MIQAIHTKTRKRINSEQEENQKEAQNMIGVLNQVVLSHRSILYFHFNLKRFPYEYQEEGAKKKTRVVTEDGGVPIAPKNFLTSPPKKGGATTHPGY